MRAEIQEKTEQERRHRAEVMGQGAVWKLLLHFSAPGILSMLVGASYNLVDAIFVGQLGPQAVAALAVAFPVAMIFVGFGMGIGVGGGSLIGQSLGAKRYAEVNKICGVTLMTTVIIGFLLTAVFMFNLNAMLQAFGATGEVFSPAWTYIHHS